MSKILGLDLGIASIGYAIVELDEKKFSKGQIITSGVRVFEKAENPKDGASLAAPRREARSLRRIIRRKTIRLQQIRQLFIKYNILSEKDLSNLYKNPLPNVWEIRANALYSKQSNRDICLALLHVAKRRGFRSMRKSEEQGNKETGKLLQGITQIKQMLEQSKYQTIGEFLYHLPSCEPRRNKEGSYSHSIARKMLEEEVHIILGKQRDYGNSSFSLDFENEFNCLAFNQNPLMPSVPGKCSFEPEENRAPKNSYTAELFNTYCKINNIRIESQGQSRKLNEIERQQVLDLCLNKEKNNYKQLRSILKLSDKEFFNIVYSIPKGKTEDYNPEEKTAIYKMTGYHTIRKALKNQKSLWIEYMDNPNNILDNISIVLSTYKSDKEIIDNLQKLAIPQELIETIKDISFSKFMHLSLKAMRKIIPFLQQGYLYNEACALAGYDFHGRTNNSKYSKLPPLTEGENYSITNPVVKRSITQTRKIVNALNRKYGPFDAVHIELTREMGKSWNKRKEIIQRQKENEEERALIKEKGIDGIYPKNALDVKKLRLWKEQNGYCIYSRKYIAPKQILEEGVCQVDHIIPYSLSFDNSLSNQVLCFTKENQEKKDSIPYDYFKRINRNWDEFVSFVESALPNMKHNKKQKLLKTKLDEKDIVGFKERNLNDTRFITTFIHNYLLQNLQLTGKYKRGIFCRNGKITSDLRHMWGLSKVREESDKHHAMDAIVLACCSNSMMQHISTLYKRNKENSPIKIKNPFPKPWENFVTDLEKSLSEIFVSRPPRKKVTGALHKETYYSAKHSDKGFRALRTDINDLTLDKLNKQRELEIKYYGAERNKNIYDAIEYVIKNRKDDNQPLEVYVGDKKTPVKKIKLITEGAKGVSVLKGTALAENGPMPRVDVFYENEKYYLVPIYTIDFTKEKLPLISVPEGKSMSIDNFVFSLYKDDYVEIINKDKEVFSGYFSQYNAQTGQIYLESQDRSTTFIVNNKPASEKKISKSTFISFNKYQIDILGGKHIVKKEKYVGITRKNRCFGG